MDTLSYKTLPATKKVINQEWLLIDAENQILGRLSSVVASLIRGKNKPYYTPYIECGDKVIIINADKIKLTGKKASQKEYIRYTGYPGGQRIAIFEDVIKKKPIFPVEKAVKGMLPKNKLGNALIKNLMVYAGSEHPHAAQQPREIKLNTII
ncbi:MAG: 50S ribosomal protein L13 [Bacteroidetes bacterium GWE2_29_8]|nr:MAG: 50S ribosomal protein L13 [Bacteroidetes bacterium GWE2_29_8]OFY22399.1 MAG: 50S ribosomal protein L13 [Bacteroidetes bacterium GWF2_29_10]